MVDALVAIKMSMLWITAITAISVVVDRMIPSRVRKLRSLLPRKESRATAAASRKEAWDCTSYRIRGPRMTCSRRAIGENTKRTHPGCSVK